VTSMRSLSAAGILGLVVGVVAAILDDFPRQEEVIPILPKATLSGETRRLEVEYPAAASRKPYLVLDLTLSRLDYRISGVTTKSIPFRIESIRAGGGEARVSLDRLALLTLYDRGAPPEVIHPPDPNAPVDPLKDPKIFPPDPPTDYTLLFDVPVKIRIEGDKPKNVRGAIRGFGRTWLDWFRGRGRMTGGAAQIRIRLPSVRAQEIYRALYREEKVLVVGIGEGGDRSTKLTGR